jgi:hypothetical protein
MASPYRENLTAEIPLRRRNRLPLRLACLAVFALTLPFDWNRHVSCSGGTVMTYTGFGLLNHDLQLSGAVLFLISAIALPLYLARLADINDSPSVRFWCDVPSFGVSGLSTLMILAMTDMGLFDHNEILPAGILAVIALGTTGLLTIVSATVDATKWWELRKLRRIELAAPPPLIPPLRIEGGEAPLYTEDIESDAESAAEAEAAQAGRTSGRMASRN